jgi:hypothetical protein
MSALVSLPDDALAAVDGDKRAKRAIRCVEHGMALSPDHLLHELQDVIAADGAYLNATPRMRGFMRAIGKRLEGKR